MWFSIANMPYISLGWIGLGFFILLIGFFGLVHHQSKEEEYTGYNDGKELFSFFLQEEEKKNEAFRKSIKEEYEDTAKEIPARTQIKKNITEQEALYNEIIRLYEGNLSVEQIAKQMKIGIGEVRLIVSLYSMR